MNIMADTVRRWGLDMFISDPDVCSPIDSWLSATSLRVDDKDDVAHLMAANSSTICVNAFWNSSRTSRERPGKQSSQERVLPSSLWGRLQQIALRESPAEAPEPKRRRQTGKPVSIPWPSDPYPLVGLPSLSRR